MDQGGTFTDVVRVDARGRVRVDKVLSAGADVDALAAGADEVRRGTTVATNALLERQGVPVLLLTTRGFGDAPWIGDQTRPRLFALTVRPRQPLTCEALEVDGRIRADGTVDRPAEVDEAALRGFREQGFTAAAVVLVHGPQAPEEERRLGLACRAAGFTQVSLGHEVAPSRGFVDRLHTTLADAALSPLLPRAPGLYMRSDGGLARESGEAETPGAGGREWRGSVAVLSGPAGGAVATASLARRHGLGPVFGLDMGGTSTDVCRVEGRLLRRAHLVVDGLRLRVPAVRLETVAAGGGSRLGRQGAVYTVGPRSAGSRPGPAAYGRGGPATVTDAEAVLGRLPGFPAVCGPAADGPLEVEAAEAALRALDAERPLEEVAWGYKLVAAEHMARAVRGLAAAEGVDPASHALVAFGGAGPGHACLVARRLGQREVWVPVLAGVFSAVGIGAARRREEVVVPWRGGLAQTLSELRLPFEGALHARLAVRYAGTQEPLEVALGPGLSMPQEGLEAAFTARHRAVTGFARPGQRLEVVELRVACVEGAAEEGGEGAPDGVGLEDLPRAAPTRSSTTRAWFGGWLEVPLRGLHEADGLVGPALLVGPGCTVVVEAGWRVEHRGDALRLVDEAPAPPRLSERFDPVHTAVFSQRLMAVAEQMGEQLARLARSVSIRERRDFSCAVFDAEGRLAANAPHVPVHLGAMGETVRDLLSRRAAELAPGQAWASNDPYAGGSHLPDITVSWPVYEGEVRVAVVAVRGHHVDVGGTTPGSMPPDATHIDEEGFVLRQVCVAREGALLPQELPGCRQPDDVRADLEAQIAACVLGARRLLELRGEVGAAVFEAQLAHLRTQARLAVAERLSELQGAHEATEILDDGCPIAVRLEVAGEAARVHMGGPPHPGNRNAPAGVARAALLYVFRCLADEGEDGGPVVLNEGALEPFELHLEGLLAPRHPAAVAGGNVETSQRLVDALFSALGALAGSQGTMNNLTVGTPRGAFYETIAGGAGAGPSGPGGSAVQVHMTNTRATDVEELEHRFPVLLERHARRRGSGGRGAHAGGDGVEKVWRFLEPAEVALMAERRAAGAPGLAGGGAGAPGVDERDRGEGWEPAPSRWRAEAGDRLRIRTPGGGGWGVPEGGEGAGGSGTDLV